MAAFHTAVTAHHAAMAAFHTAVTAHHAAMATVHTAVTAHHAAMAAFHTFRTVAFVATALFALAAPFATLFVLVSAPFKVHRVGAFAAAVARHSVALEHRA